MEQLIAIFCIVVFSVGLLIFSVLNKIAANIKEISKPAHNNARDEILCDFPTGCGMRSNGRCDLADPCDKYIPHKTSPVA